MPIHVIDMAAGPVEDRATRGVAAIVATVAVIIGFVFGRASTRSERRHLKSRIDTDDDIYFDTENKLFDCMRSYERLAKKYRKLKRG